VLQFADAIIDGCGVAGVLRRALDIHAPSR
jgi:hypothetical protein